MLPAQKPHVSGVRDARTESVRFPQTEQVLTVAAEVYSADIESGEWVVRKGRKTSRVISGNLLMRNIDLRKFPGSDCTAEIEAAWPDSCRLEARKHHVG